jgi:hypothetical protein
MDDIQDAMIRARSGLPVRRSARDVRTREYIVAQRERRRQAQNLYDVIQHLNGALIGYHEFLAPSLRPYADRAAEGMNTELERLEQDILFASNAMEEID